MKKSNQILLGALIAILVFTVAFQLTVHSYVRKENRSRDSITFLSQERSIGAFQGIKSNERIHVFLRQDSSQQVMVKAPSNRIDSVKTTLNGDTLLIKVTGKIKKKDSIRVEVSMPTLNFLMLSGKSSLTSTESFSGDMLELNLSDDSSAKLDLQYDTVLYRNTSDGQVIINGAIEHIQINNSKNE